MHNGGNVKPARRYLHFHCTEALFKAILINGTLRNQGMVALAEQLIRALPPMVPGPYCSPGRHQACRLKLHKNMTKTKGSDMRNSWFRLSVLASAFLSANVLAARQNGALAGAIAGRCLLSLARKGLALRLDR